MSAIAVTIVGSIIDACSPEGRPCTIVGLASLTGLGVGGGPILPPSQPPSIWPSPGHPAHPIVLPPMGGGGAHPEHPIYWPPHPEHPIVLPPSPIVPPEPPQLPPTFTPPPPGSVITPPGAPAQPVNPIVMPKFILVYYPGFGWLIVTAPAGQPSPK